MFQVWLIGFIITLGLLVAYVRSKAKLKDVPAEKQNLFTEIDWSDNEGGSVLVVIMCGIFCLFWPVTLPIWWVYLIGKKIFK